jgi:phage terminase large subunit
MAQTKVFWKNVEAFNKKARVIANKGGTRSGKTYSIMTFLAYLAMNAKKKLEIDVVSESLPHLKRGALHDFEEIIDNLGAIEKVHFEINKTDHIYEFKGGGIIRFFAAEDWGKIKGSRRNILFINECNRIPYEVYRQLAVRTTRCIFLDWNPDAEFWYEEKGICAKENTIEIHSTYKDNEYLSREQIDEIESNKSDESWWNVYGLGLVGMAQGLIYTNWEQCARIPDEAVLIGHGLDFGFTNDPTAIVSVYRAHGALYIKERCYRVGMVNTPNPRDKSTNDKSIAIALQDLEGDIIADSAEPKSIEEIHNWGIKRIEESKKGRDSIRSGIDILRRYKLYVTSDSLNVIKEFRNYKYKEDKMTGQILQEPIDKFNHAMDALRYVALNKLAKKVTRRGLRTKLKRY